MGEIMATTEQSLGDDAIDLLQMRLKRVEYAIYGHRPHSVVREAASTATQRLKELERAVDHIISRSRVRQDLMKLYALHPELFRTSGIGDNLSVEDLQLKLPIILAAAASYPQTASGLTSILDTPIPSAELSTRLIEAEPELAKLQLIQKIQAQEVAELKQRSASILRRWYSINVLRAGEYWADVEGSIEQLEIRVRRANAVEEQEGEAV